MIKLLGKRAALGKLAEWLIRVGARSSDRMRALRSFMRGWRLFIFHRFTLERSRSPPPRLRSISYRVKSAANFWRKSGFHRDDDTVIRICINWEPAVLADFESFGGRTGSRFSVDDVTRYNVTKCCSFINSHHVGGDVAGKLRLESLAYTELRYVCSESPSYLSNAQFWQQRSLRTCIRNLNTNDNLLDIRGRRKEK